MHRLALVLAIATALTPHAGWPVSWFSCADDLDTLHKFASEAAEVARRVESAARALESCRSMAALSTVSIATDDCS